jgi:hypothetical protein
MNKPCLALAVIAMALAACSTAPDQRRPGEPWSEGGFDLVSNPPPTLCSVKVYVLDDQIVVDQEPAAVARCGDSRTTITWALPARTSYTFPTDGIAFKGTPAPERADCAVQPSRKVFKCNFERPPRGTQYSYSVKVMKDGVALPPLDPHVLGN